MGLVGRITEIKWVESVRENNKNSTDISPPRKRDKSWVRITFSEMGAGVISHSGTFHGNSTNTGSEDVAAGTNKIHILTGKRVTLRVQFSPSIYPFTGYVAVSVSATTLSQSQSQATTQSLSQSQSQATTQSESKGFRDTGCFTGRVYGKLHVTVETPGPPILPHEKAPSIIPNKNKKHLHPLHDFEYDAERDVQSSTATADITVQISRIPPRNRRLLWDVYHNIGYPSAFVPRDDLDSSRWQLALVQLFSSI
jgi:hypothetical protein